MIFEHFKRPLAGLVAASLLIGSACFEVFADEIKQIEPQEQITVTSTDVTNPSKTVTIKTEDGEYPVTDATTIYIDKGTTRTFKVYIGDGVENCDDGFVYSSSDSKKLGCSLVIDENDPLSAVLSVTGKSAGTYTVLVATLSGMANQKINVTVLDPITSIKLKCDGEEIEGDGVIANVNRRRTMTAVTTPSSTTDSVKWSVSDTTKAEISEDGVLTAKKPGTITVTATAVNSLYLLNDYTDAERAAYGLNQRTYSCSTYVTILEANPITNLGFDYEEGVPLKLNVNDIYDASAHLTTIEIRDPLNSSTDNIVWSSSDESVVKVNSTTGLLTVQNKSGFATITASTDSVEPVKASFVVNVYTPVSVLKFTQDSYLLDLNEKSTGNIIVVEDPETANEPLIWSIVDNNGIIEPIEFVDGETDNIKILRVKTLKTGVVKITASTDRTPTEKDPEPKNVSTTCEIEVVESAKDYTSLYVKEGTEPANVTYNGKEQKVAPVITDSVGNVLTEGKDYTITYSEDLVNAGKVTIAIVGVESASQYGKINLSYYILPADISGATLPTISDMTYNYGNELVPSSNPVIRFGTVQLFKDYDYTITYTNNTEVGQASANITGIGNYTGNTVIYYNIVPRAISSAKITTIDQQTYTGFEIIPDYTVTSGDVTLVEDVDYTVTYSNNINVGTASAVFSGIGNYNGTLNKTSFFKIIKKDVTKDSEVAIEEIPEQPYMGGMPVCPELVITYNGIILTEGIDYTLTYSNNLNPGTEASVTANFAKSANFSGSLTKNFTIVNRDVAVPASAIIATDTDGNDIANDTIIYLDTKEKMYIDIALDEPSADCDDALLVAIKTSNDNATVAFESYSRDGKTATISVTGKKGGSFMVQIFSLSGEVNKKLNFTILVPTTKVEIYYGNLNITSNGLSIPENHQCTLKSKLTPSNTTDVIEWSVDDTDKAEISEDGIFTAKRNGTVIVTAKVKPSENSPRGLYATTTVTIIKANPITQMNFPFKDISLKVSTTYEAAAVLNKSVLDTTNSSTDNITWSSDNTSVAKVDAQTGKVTILSKKGTAVITATTDSMTPVSASFTINTYTPVTSMKFSTANYTILTGETFDIILNENPVSANEEVKWTVSDESVLQIVDSSYDPQSYVQKLKVKALKAGDCQISAITVRVPTLNDPKPVQVEATCGAVVVDPINMSNITVTLSGTSFDYKGTAITPSVTVKYGDEVLTDKTDYTVSYSDNIQIGTAKVTVTGAGKYVGKIEKTFSIKLPGVSGLKVTKKDASSVTLQWAKNTYATGYVVERFDGSKWATAATITSNSTITTTITGLSSGSAEQFRVKASKTVGTQTYYSDPSAAVSTATDLVGVSGLKVSAKTNTSVTLQWTKNAYAAGYVIERYDAATKTWVKVTTLTSNTKVSYTVSGLKASTTYKFRISAYKGSVSSVYTELSVNTRPYTTTGLKAASKTNTTITLQWNKNISATGYVLDKYDGTKWVTIAKITSNSTVSYTVKGLAASRTYKFRLKAYKNYGSLAESSAFSYLNVNTRPYTTTGLKTVSKTNTSITLGWNKNISATGYVLDKYDGKKWVTVKKITSNSTVSYTVSGLSASKTYKFRLKAYKTIGTANESSAFTYINVNTRPYTTTGFKAKSVAKTSVTLQWNKNISANGYCIEKWDGKKWVQIKRYTSNANTSYTLSGLKSRTTYKIRLRAYKTISGVNEYSAYSNLTVKTV